MINLIIIININKNINGDIKIINCNEVFKKSRDVIMRDTQKVP